MGSPSSVIVSAVGGSDISAVISSSVADRVRSVPWNKRTKNYILNFSLLNMYNKGDPDR